MAGSSGCFGSRRQERTARSLRDRPTTEEEPGLPTRVAPTDGQRPPGLVIQAPRAGDAVEPPSGDGASRPHGSGDLMTEPRFGIIIGRYQATVVVTVHGALDPARAELLGHLLADQIDRQGNLSLVVDLSDATAADAHPLSVLAAAAERARRCGGAMTISKPPESLRQALRHAGLGHLLGTGLQATLHRGPASEGTRSRLRPSSAHLSLAFSPSGREGFREPAAEAMYAILLLAIKLRRRPA